MVSVTGCSGSTGTSLPSGPRRMRTFIPGGSPGAARPRGS